MVALVVEPPAEQRAFRLRLVEDVAVHPRQLDDVALPQRGQVARGFLQALLEQLLHDQRPVPEGGCRRLGQVEGVLGLGSHPPLDQALGRIRPEPVVECRADRLGGDPVGGGGVAGIGSHPGIEIDAPHGRGGARGPEFLDLLDQRLQVRDAGGRRKPGRQGAMRQRTRLRLRDLALPGARASSSQCRGGSADGLSASIWIASASICRARSSKAAASLASLKARARRSAQRAQATRRSTSRGLSAVAARSSRSRSLGNRSIATTSQTHWPASRFSTPSIRTAGARRRRLEPEPGREPKDDRSALQVDLIVGTVGNRILPIVVPLKPRHAIVDSHHPADQVGSARQLRGFDQRDGRLGRAGPNDPPGCSRIKARGCRKGLCGSLLHPLLRRQRRQRLASRGPRGPWGASGRPRCPARGRPATPWTVQSEVNEASRAPKVTRSPTLGWVTSKRRKPVVSSRATRKGWSALAVGQDLVIELVPGWARRPWRRRARRSRGRRR